LNIKVQASHHPLAGVLVGAGTVAAIAGGSGLLVYRAHRRRRLLMKERLRALVRIWQHPEQVARPSRGPFVVDLARSIALSLLTLVVSQVAKRSLLRIFPELPAKTGTGKPGASH
jgi:hypothetical protein